MSDREITARVYRFDPAADDGASYREYLVPLTPGDSAMNVLDYIYQNLDGTLAYYDHAGCALGICARCTGRVNGKLGLLCQMLVEGDVTLEPMSEEGLTRDLVVIKTRKGSAGASKTGRAGSAGEGA
jgi:succinate dehydrogenase/fumarate reductase-like Fe-S protein